MTSLFSHHGRNKRVLIMTIGGFVIVAILAFVIGYVSRSTSCDSDSSSGSKSPSTGAMTDEEREKQHQSIVDLMDTENLRANMRYFASKPHVASFPRTFENSAEIYKRFQKYGFTPSFHEYDTLLSSPKPKEPNFVYIQDVNGTTLFRSRAMEMIYEQGENNTNSLPPFLAYAPSGNVTGDLVYANYGRKEDYDMLLEQYHVNVTGKIVLTKYGGSGRGAKVAMAAERGAIGCLIYGDPKNYAPVASEKFPNGRWLSDDAVQRGSILYKGADGDPMTGGYPSKVWASRDSDFSKVKGLAKIPAQPIASSDAEQLLKILGGQNVPEEWKGDLNVTYNTGPIANSSLKVRLVVKNELEVKRIRNVCGTMLGKVEPDRYILLGNHIDSWVFGAVDATSGTTVMMEIARALGQKHKTGWKPRRTIRLCGWDGEESNLIGSVEYVEEYFSQLFDKAIVYINVDSAVAGNNSLKTAASPLLHEMMFSAHKLVSDPYRDETVYDRCMIEYKDKNYNKTHNIYQLGAGSDYYAFYKFIGIPSIDLSYRQTDLDKLYNTSYYPQYHTLHDTIYWMENFVDKEYKIHLTVARVALLYVLKLADTPILPLTIQRYSDAIHRGVKGLKKLMNKNNVNNIDKLVAPLESAAQNFSVAMTTFTNYLNVVKKDKEKMSNVLLLRMLNDKLMQLEKGFTYPSGLPGKPQVKHYLMAFGSEYADVTCPLPAIAGLVSSLNNTDEINEFNKQVSITTSLIEAVSESLNADIAV